MNPAPTRSPLRTRNFKDDEPVAVSVVVIAYNVEDYIAEALDSILDQETDFRVEIVVGEDCSTDGTLYILEDYARRYPSAVRVLAHPENLGLTPNSIATQDACRGTYVALCDGDDYWTHKDKLQRQVDFLNAHPECSASGHQSHFVYGEQFNKAPHLFRPEMGAACDLGIPETITHRKFHTSSLVYRREYWVKSGGIPSSISSNERAIYPMLAIYGKIRYFPESMCVYRLGGAGLSSRITAEELATDMTMVPWLRSLSKDFPAARFRAFLHLCAFTYPRKVALGSLAKHYFSFLFFSFSYFPKNAGDVKHATIKFFQKITI